MYQRTSQRYTILYVDDESENLTGFKFLFRRNYHILLANSGEEALNMMRANEVHLLLADHRMPKMTGSALLARVAEEFPDVLRMIVTGYSDIEGIIEAVNKGRIYYYVTKPWNADELKVIIDRALEAYQLKIDNRLLIQNLTKSNAELDTFLYRSSHDLRRPITTMLGLGQVAQMSLTDSKALDLFAKVSDTAQGMLKMLRKLYMVNDVYASSDADIDVIDMEELMQEVLPPLKELIQEHGVDVQYSLEGEVAPFRSNHVLIKHILFNLIENSLIFSRPTEGRYVRIRIFFEDTQINIKVSDNGIGILPEYLSKIFDMYFVASEMTTGNGLGLYVVKKSLEKLEGECKVISEFDLGSTFSVTFPIIIKL